MTYSFSIGLFEVGDAKSCLYSFLCTPCAMAESRHQLDGSGFCFNIFCLPIVPYRWMVRTAYDIGNPSDCAMDCLLSTFCTCCVVNQLYQTTSIKGNPTTDGGAQFNTQSFTTTPCNFVGCLYAFFCLPCSIGTILQDSVGMPFLLGCCCFNLFNARNVVRYQYRIKHRMNSTSDCSEECLIPWFVYVIANCTLSFFCPCFQICLFPFLCGAVVAIDMELLSESSTRKGGQNQAYLRGYSLPPALVSIAPGAVEMTPYVVNPIVNYNPAPASSYGQQPMDYNTNLAPATVNVTYAQQQMKPVYSTITNAETFDKQ